MPKDYKLNLIRQLQNLRQKGMTIKEYTEEFFRLSIRAGNIQWDIERDTININGIIYEIQGDIILLNLKIIEDAYQASSRVEEKLLRRLNQKNRGISTTTGKWSPNRGKF